MLGTVVLILAIFAMIAAIWGQEAARGCFTFTFVAIGAVVFLLVGFVWYQLDSDFRKLVHLYFAGVGLVIAFSISRAIVDAGKNRAYRAEREAQKRQTQFEERMRAEAEERRRAERTKSEEDAQRRRDQRIDTLTRDLKAALEARNEAQSKSLGKTMRDMGVLQLVLPSLKLAVNDLDPAKRLCAVRALQYGYDKTYTGQEFVGFNAEALELLCQISMDRDETTRNRVAALIAIGTGGYSDGKATLTELLTDGDGDVRAAACRGLGGLGAHATLGADCLHDIMAKLKDATERVRKEAAQALGQCRDVRALRALQAVVANVSESAKVREAAQLAIQKIQSSV